MTTIITRGSVSAQALGYAARSTDAAFIEDVFSTYLYAGNDGTQTITTGLDLSTKGGLVWIKNRTTAPSANAFTDTVRGPGTGTSNTATNVLVSSSTNGTGGGLPSTSNDYLSAFTTTGFTVVASNGANNATRITNRASDNYVAWSFEKQSKFFDIVTYTGNGANRTINHNLGSVPGCIFIKRVNGIGSWVVYHRGMNGGVTPAQYYMNLEATSAQTTLATAFNNTEPTSTDFSVGTNGNVNLSGASFIAYIFAHNAGGFGAAGTDNVISCGTYTGTGVSGNSITLGYEPQWIMLKAANTTGNWFVIDNMRPFGVTQTSYMYANTTAVDATAFPPGINPTATGFVLPTTSLSYNGSGSTYIYVAIRRGPMRTPTSSTNFFSPNAVTISGQATVTTGFPVDMSMTAARSVSSDRYVTDRLRSSNLTDAFWVRANSTGTQVTGIGQNWASNTSIIDNIWNGFVLLSGNVVFWNFRRAPGFFDVVCYTGTGANTTQTHNLGAVPELMLVKRRTGGASAWAVYSAGISNTEYLTLDTNAAKATDATRWNSTTPTNTAFSIGTDATVNASGSTYVAYLFATLAFVSKVGAYTGNGTSQTINCGFSAGSRFVMIKRTDSTGNWTIFDSARGIVAGNDPAIAVNDGLAETTTIDAVDTDNSGFIVNQDVTLNLNVNAATYIFLAIA